MARSGSPIGALSRSASTAATALSPRIFDATAPCAVVQNTQAFVFDTNVSTLTPS